jgi:hypothetical protein
MRLTVEIGGNAGGYDKEEKAARAYDMAALKYWGPTTTTNFPVSDQPTLPRQRSIGNLHACSSDHYLYNVA